MARGVEIMAVKLEVEDRGNVKGAQLIMPPSAGEWHAFAIDGDWVWLYNTKYVDYLDLPPKEE